MYRTTNDRYAYINRTTQERNYNLEKLKKIYYYIDIDSGNHMGPHSLNEMKRLYKNKTISKQSFIWKDPETEKNASFILSHHEFWTEHINNKNEIDYYYCEDYPGVKMYINKKSGRRYYYDKNGTSTYELPEYFYIDTTNETRGPYPKGTINHWYMSKKLYENTLIWKIPQKKNDAIIISSHPDFRKEVPENNNDATNISSHPDFQNTGSANGGGKISKKKTVTKDNHKGNRRIYTGTRGGKFYIKGGKKVYI